MNATNSENFVHHMDSLVSYIDTELLSFNQGSMALNKEVQFNDWFFNYIHPSLVKKGFIVEPDVENKDIIPNINEYSTSKPDCLIYHETSVCQEHISAVNVQVMDASTIDSQETTDNSCSSVRSVNVKDLDEMTIASSLGCTLEIKSKLVDNAALNECFCNVWLGNKAGNNAAANGQDSEKGHDVWNCS